MRDISKVSVSHFEMEQKVLNDRSRLCVNAQAFLKIGLTFMIVKVSLLSYPVLYYPKKKKGIWTNDIIVDRAFKKV